MREALVTGLREEGVEDMDFIAEQNGMFSFSGLSVAQMHQLRSDFGVYGTDDGRMCVAGLNEENVQVVARAIAQVRRDEDRTARRLPRHRARLASRGPASPSQDDSGWEGQA